jgi:hypothetical protein
MKPPDSVLVACYMKSQIASIQGGLIPLHLRNLLINLLKNYGPEGKACLINDDLPEGLAVTVYSLLSFDDHRLEILRIISAVAQLILEKGTIDKINSLMLARIIKVSGSEVYDSILNDGRENSISPLEAKEISDKLDEWNSVWGFILEKRDIFLYQDSFEESLIRMENKIKMDE